MSILVMMTSFIPVFGVVLSTLPMALVALTEYGVSRAVDVILMVIGVHVAEVRAPQGCSAGGDAGSYPSSALVVVVSA